MSSRPAKRPRSNTATDAVDPSKLPSLVNSIDSRTTANLLITAAKAYPDIASLIQQEADRLAAIERAKVVDFDYLSNSAWRTLNVTYDRMKDSHAFEMAGEAARDVEGCFEEIQRDCSENASFKTKENALETLRKIGKSICLSVGVIPREIRKDYRFGGELVPVMLRIAESLTEEEAERLRPWCEDKLVELQGIASGHGIFEGLGEVIDLWGWDEEGEGEDEDAGSGDGKEEGEGESEDDDDEVGEDAYDESFVAGMMFQKRRQILGAAR